MKFINLTPEITTEDGEHVAINPYAIAFIYPGEGSITVVVLINGASYGVRESEEQIKMLCAEV